MTVFSNLRTGLFLSVVAALLTIGGPGWGEEISAPIATVNQQPVLQRDVDLELLISGVKNPTATDREAALNRVIDRTLVTEFIQPRGSDPLAEDVEELVQFVRRGIESGGDTVDNVLGKLNLSEEDIRQAARKSVSWNAYVHRTISDREVRAYFEQHREELDGTRIQIRQIVRTVPVDAPGSQWDEAEKLLTGLRQQIESGQLDFAEAANTHSLSPSRKNGGDVGWIRFQGDVPASVASVAFSLKPGKMSSPIRSKVGVHLIQITDRMPGDLSLEDARPEVLRILGNQLWDRTVQMLRAKAKITQ